MTLPFNQINSQDFPDEPISPEGATLTPEDFEAVKKMLLMPTSGHTDPDEQDLDYDLAFFSQNSEIDA